MIRAIVKATLIFALLSACSVERVEIDRPKKKTPEKPPIKTQDPPPLNGKKNVDELGHKLIEVDSQSGFREIESRSLQLFALGRLDEALTLLEPHGSDKDNLGAQRMLAMIHLRKGDADKAKAHVDMYNAHPGAVPQVKAEFTRRIERLKAGAKGTFNHAPLTSILEKAVKTKPSGNTEVDYNVVVSRAGDLETYLRAIGEADAGALSDLERMAFYTNAYNAWTLQAVLNNKLHTAGAKVKSVQSVPGFFDKKRFPIAGEQLTLNELEEKKLRPPNGPPEVHFVVNCASVSCPPLRATAYTGADIEKALVEQTTAYIKRDVNVKGKTIEVVKLFDWYKKDFGGDKGVRDFLVKYGVKEAADPSMKIVFKTYDWRLNRVR